MSISVGHLNDQAFVFFTNYYVNYAYVWHLICKYIFLHWHSKLLSEEKWVCVCSFLQNKITVSWEWERCQHSTSFSGTLSSVYSLCGTLHALAMFTLVPQMWLAKPNSPYLRMCMCIPFRVNSPIPLLPVFPGSASDLPWPLIRIRRQEKFNECHSKCKQNFGSSWNVGLGISTWSAPWQFAHRLFTYTSHTAVRF